MSRRCGCSACSESSRRRRVPGEEAPITNWELVYKYQVHVIGLNIGVLIQAAPQIFGQVMGELFALIADGCSPPASPPCMNSPTARKPSRNWKPGPPSVS
jgi:hypothetical protein